MLFHLRIKATEPFLGNKRTPPAKPGDLCVRRFVRKEEEIALDLAQWNWAVEQAALALHIDIDTNSVRFPVSIQRPSLVLYVRRWHHQGKRKEEMFESIRDGAELGIDVLLTSVSENENKRPPTQDEFLKIMTFIGDMLGLSPFGSKFGYGRFKVISLEPK